jgi:hypothetical protein
MWRLLTIALLLAACQSAQPTPPVAPTYAPQSMQPAASNQNNAYSRCPVSTRWDGYACVYTYVITDVRCPPGATWSGRECVARSVVCPAGAHWIKGRCIAAVAKPGEAATFDDGEIFESRQPSLRVPDDDPPEGILYDRR